MYLDKVKESNQINNYKDNRLYNLYETHITKKNISPNIISYSGGPGSILGVGKTNIKFADQRTGKNNPYSISGATTWTPKITNDNWTIPYPITNTILKPILSGSGITDPILNSIVSTRTNINIPIPSVYKLGPDQTILNNNDEILYANGSITYNQTQIISQSAQSKTNFGSPSLQDFRTNLLEQNDAGYIMSAAPEYAIKNIDSPSYIGMDSAGKKGNKKSYTKGKNDNVKGVIDTITSLGVQQGQYYPDLCSFRIDFLNTGRDIQGFVNKFIQFRAYLDNISDNYNPNWNSFKYPGRADSFYIYEGFDRKLTLGWSIVALSKGELEPMYEKLNYLASATTAEYSQYGYMKGVLTQLTIGNYIKELPGFINSLTYDISTDTTWEIGIDDTGSFSGKQLPHMIKVTMGYTPIPTQLARFEVNPTSTPRFVNMQ